MSRFRGPDAVWAVFWVAGLAVETLGLRGVTIGGRVVIPPFSRTAARVFRTDTTGGKVSFACAWGLLTWWFIPHVWRYRLDEE